MSRPAPVQSPAAVLIGKTVRVTFGQHYGQQGSVLEAYEPHGIARPQRTVMIRFASGKIAVVPVKDVEVVP